MNDTLKRLKLLEPYLSRGICPHWTVNTVREAIVEIERLRAELADRPTCYPYQVEQEEKP